MLVQPSTPASSASVLLPELRERIAAQLDARDLIALSQVSRDWRRASEPAWQRAYGPGPCHRAADTPAHWRRAVHEKVEIERRLTALLGQDVATPAALLGIGERLRKRAPLAALMAFRLAGPQGYQRREATQLVLENLYHAKRYDELTAYAATALQAHPSLARLVMPWAITLFDLNLYRLVDKVYGSAPRYTAGRLSPTTAVRMGNLEVLRYLIENPAGLGEHDWSRALTLALQQGQVSFAREILAVCRAPNAAVDLTAVPEVAAQEVIAFFQEAEIETAAALIATASGRPPVAQEMCRRLIDASSTPAQRQAAMNAASTRAICNGSLSALRTLEALGGQADLSAGLASLERDRCPLAPPMASWMERKMLTLLLAGAAPDAPITGTPLLTLYLRHMKQHCSSLSAMREALNTLATAKVALHACHLEAARQILDDCSADASVLRSFLAMGYPPAGHELRECARRGKLEAVQLLVEAGAPLHEYDEAFCTALDLAKDSRVIAYLQGQGAQPLHIDVSPVLPGIPAPAVPSFRVDRL